MDYMTARNRSSFYQKEIKKFEDYLSNIFGSLFRRLTFPKLEERNYQNFLIEKSIKSEVPIIVLAVFIFITLSIADFIISSQDLTLFIVRSIFSALILAGSYFIPKMELAKKGFILVALGTYVSFWLALWSYVTSVESTRHIYHLWALSFFLFNFLVFRNGFRIMAISTGALYVTYVCMILTVFDNIEYKTEFDLFVEKITGFYLAVLTFLVFIGAFLAQMAELSLRLDFLKNQLLSHETERLQTLTRDLEKLSLTDSLTGLANRRYAEARLDEAWESSFHLGSTISLLMVDVDKFKDFNDTYGHQQGDMCLQQIAHKLLRVGKRKGDLSARYGGEEFLIILSQADAEQACELAERLRNDIEALKLEHEKSQYGVVTISIGVATGDPTEYSSIGELLKSADTALYQAKAEGRNRVVLLDNPAEQG